MQQNADVQETAAAKTWYAYLLSEHLGILRHALRHLLITRHVDKHSGWVTPARPLVIGGIDEQQARWHRVNLAANALQAKSQILRACRNHHAMYRDVTSRARLRIHAGKKPYK